MVRFKQFLLLTAGGGLLCGCTETGFAQNAHVVTAGTLGDDIATSDDYGWIDRARALWDAVGDAPPDYGFGFDGGRPMAWETRDGYWVVVDDRAEGTTTYFFAPGERGPFLVRETDRSFGYQNGHVAAVYDRGGTLLPRYEGARWLDEGEDQYRRGRRLRDALLDRQWEPVDTTRWTDLNLFFIGIDPGWDSNWRYRNDGYVLAEQRRWAAERARRAAMAAAFARWRNGGFQGPPPPGLGHHWEHRPPRPGRPPNAGAPPPGAGQPAPPPGSRPPGRPWMWGGQPGAGGDRPDRPPRGPRPNPTPPPGTVPGAPPPPDAAAPVQPPVTGAPGWHGGGPGRPRPDGTNGRPPRPDGYGGGRAGWQGPPPGWQGWRPGGAPPQPGSPPAAAPASPPPAAAAPAGEGSPRRGGWRMPNWPRQDRPEASAGETPRPAFRPPAARAEGAPAPSRPSPPPPHPAPRAEPAVRPSPPPRPEPRPMPALRAKLEARHE